MKTLFDIDPPPAPVRPITIAERFEWFHRQHPEVYEMYRRFAYQLLRAGCKRGSTQQILGRIRWETALNPGHDGGFKVNEVYKKHYAKKLVDEDPAFAEFFEFRNRCNQ